MKHYIIDGNNLIGKIRKLSTLQGKDKQGAREQLVYILNRFFSGKNIKVSLHLDGFPGTTLNISKGKIFYSESKTADEKIKDQITNTKNRKELVVISSDNGIRNYAKVCGCSLQSSEEFYKEYDLKNQSDDEEKRIKEINDVEEFKRLFNVKK